MFGFYVLILLTLAFDVAYTILIVEIYVNWMPFVLYMGPTFKLLSGLEQTWMMCELTIHLRAEIVNYKRQQLRQIGSEGED